jgi:CO/xanthine dehydrogenase Mo-binding subunit
LGVGLEDTRIVQGDSAVAAHGTGSYASRIFSAAMCLAEVAISAPAAIANALPSLDGEIFELPMTPEQLFRLVAKIKV